jgi:hypothetical protein
MDVIFSRDDQFMCRALRIPIPFLQVSGTNEYCLFTLLVHQLSGFDDFQWCKHVDGVSLFRKLPVYLRGYHNHWLRNQQIQDPIKNMKSEIELLEAINKRQTPAEISQPTGISRIMTEGDDSGGLSADNDVEENCLWALAWLGPAFPSMIARPMQRAVHPRVLAKYMWALRVQCTVWGM